MVVNKKIFDGQFFYSVMRMLGGAFFVNLRAEKIIFSLHVVPAKAGTQAELQNSVH